MASVWEIDNWIDRKAKSFIKSFYPTVVARETELPLPIVFERLLSHAKDEKLILKWEVRCPDCFYTVTILDEFPMSIPPTIFCHHCQDEVEFTFENIFPMFEIDPEYKNYVRSQEAQKKKGVRSRNINRDRVNPVSIVDEGLYTKGSLEILEGLSTGFAQFLKNNKEGININTYQYIEGDSVMSKYNFSNAKIDAADHGQVVIGEHQNVSHIVQSSKNVTETLLEELEKVDMDSNVKQEIKGAIEAVEQQVEGGNPNKFVLKGIMESLQKGIEVVITKSPALITAYESWKKVISPFL
ncbi:hypothetical protein [Bacillus paranthracis]|uniref:Uncharacterized protein n=1 Tax=Bacillus paranthracis TaxID=2026186 RepID=A0A9X8X595_9BACI|nr:hypothetical protein [Bacillus paranthracis]MCR6792060.1 hypothetical protein [Bacillus paranthracis]MDR4163794.1 hypothetical protein [Bacillus paranthracis]MED1168906.1 hypothetical protein [Bacillus paranthracis]SME05973.1 hypothetical protein BACERE00221_02361 [Bacillus paranthracis]